MKRSKKMKKEQSSNSTQKVKYALAEKYDQENKEKNQKEVDAYERLKTCLLYTSPSPRDGLLSRMPSSA